MPSIEQLCQQYRALRFNGIAKSLPNLLKRAEENEFSCLRFATMLVEDEQKQRTDRRIALARRKAGFSVCKQLEEFDYHCQSTITKRQINQLLDFTFIDNRENIVFIGASGLGKTHLAIGIGDKALNHGYKVWFTTALSLVELLEMAEMKSGRDEERTEKEDQPTAQV